MIERGGELHGDVAGLDGCAHVAGDADEADDFPAGIAHRELGGEAPSRFVRRVPVQFQMVEERASGSQDGGVLRGRDAAKITGTDVAGPLAEYLRFGSA